MLNIDFETFGFYEPGFLHLRVDTDEDIFDLNTLFQNPDTRGYSSTFLHEYIHFLQEVTTTSGLFSANHYINLIKEINSSVRGTEAEEFKVPFDFNNENNILANHQLKQIYRGGSEKSNYVKYDFYETEFEPVTDRDGRITNVVKYKIFYFDYDRNQQRSFYFGSTCLKEYVAHAIQNQYFPDTAHPDIPYLIAELIIQKEYPELTNDVGLLIALCDACLMDIHPARTFFNTLERMKSENFIPKKVTDIYDFTLQSLSFKGLVASGSVENVFSEISNQADKQFHNALQSDPFLPNYHWLKHILLKAKELRLSNPSFMTQLVDKKGDLTEVFFELFRNLGTPYFTNNTGHGGFIPPTNIDQIPNQPYQLLVFREIINIYMGKKTCGLYSFCSLRTDDPIINEKCLSAPWEKATESELCPFAQLWKTWGMVGKVPVNKKQ